MSRILLIVACLLTAQPVCGELITTLEDIDSWIGTGANEAALVVDFNNGEDAVAWGYRWDGTATTENMMRAIAADGELYFKLGAPGGFGTPIYGVGIDRDLDGFSISDSSVFVAGISEATAAPGDPVAIANDTDDTYVEGWVTGFWGYYLGTGEPFNGGSWGFATVGISSNELADGDWNGFSFAPGFVLSDPSQPRLLAVPEPHAIALLLVAAICLLWVFQHRR